MPKLKGILDKIPKITTIIYFEDQLHKTDTKGFEKVRIVPYMKVLEMGCKNQVGKFFFLLRQQSSSLNSKYPKKNSRTGSTYERRCCNYNVYKWQHRHTERRLDYSQQLYHHSEMFL
jgi:hypothetical protein